MNKSTALIAALFALSFHAPGRAQPDDPQAGSRALQHACLADADIQKQMERSKNEQLRKAKKHLIAAAYGSHRGSVPAMAPTQVACKAPSGRIAAAAR